MCLTSVPGRFVLTCGASLRNWAWGRVPRWWHNYWRTEPCRKIIKTCSSYAQGMKGCERTAGEAVKACIPPPERSLRYEIASRWPNLGTRVRPGRVQLARRHVSAPLLSAPDG